MHALLVDSLIWDRPEVSVPHARFCTGTADARVLALAVSGIGVELLLEVANVLTNVMPARPPTRPLPCSSVCLQHVY